MHNPVLLILFRWFHIISAAIVIGGLIYVWLVLPAGVKNLDPESGKSLVRAVRRRYKMLLHTCILLLIVSGTYNSIASWSAYAAWPGVLHGLWGMHVALALTAFGFSIWLTMGELPPPSHKRWAVVNILILLTLVAVAGTLKTLRGSSRLAAAAPQSATR